MKRATDCEKQHSNGGCHLSTTAELAGRVEKARATSSDMHKEAKALAALHLSLTSPCTVRSAFVIDSSPLRRDSYRHSCAHREGVQFCTCFCSDALLKFHQKQQSMYK